VIRWVFVGLVSWAAIARAESQNTIFVHLPDTDGIRSPLLFQAKGVTASILASAGVRVRWVGGNPVQNECSEDASRITIAVRFSPTAPAESSRRALAAARPFATSGVGIEVFLDRLRPMMERLSRPEVLIGHVLAHEIGHKLLRTDSHSPTGLMKAHWSNVETEQMTFQPMTFTPADAAQIRENLAGGCRLLAAAAGPIAN